MAEKFVFELDREGVRQLLKSDEIRSEISKRTDEVLKAAGDGYKSDIKTGSHRIYGNVSVANVRTWHKELKYNTLQKALNAAKHD